MRTEAEIREVIKEWNEYRKLKERLRRLGPRQRDKIKARKALSDAIRGGKIKRLPCECGDPHSEGHHPDYSKPLKVVWLCRKHHRQLHNKLNKSQ